MKTPIHLLVMLTTGLLIGCGQGGSSGSSGAAADIEGTYLASDDPDISVIIKNGDYQQGASDIHLKGKFTARKIDDKTWELDVTHSGDLAGEKSTIIVRKQGDYIFVKDKEMGDERKFKRK